jgi:hypothetical protein
MSVFTKNRTYISPVLFINIQSLLHQNESMDYMAVLGATNLTGCNSIPDFIAGGSVALFFQAAAAPTSWTKSTSQENTADML